jgi:hypothetical protein
LLVALVGFAVPAAIGCWMLDVGCSMFDVPFRSWHSVTGTPQICVIFTHPPRVG